MKATLTKCAETSQPPVVPIAVQKRVAKSRAASPTSKPQKYDDNIITKPRNTRVDHSAHQLMTTLDSKTLFRTCALL